MAYKKSPLDSISDSLAPVMRRLSDIQPSLLVGTKTSILRIKEESRDLLGDKTFSYQSQVINNVIIRYPFSSVELFASKDTQGNLNTQAIDLLDLLPITMKIPFGAMIVGQPDAPIEIDENDFIIDVLYDHKRNPIVMKMQVSRIYGGFFGRNQVSRKYDLKLKRGTESSSIENVITAYINAQTSGS